MGKSRWGWADLGSATSPTLGCTDSPAFWLNLKDPLSTWRPIGAPAAPQTDGVSKDMSHTKVVNHDRNVMWRRCLIGCKGQKQGMYVIWRGKSGGV